VPLHSLTFDEEHDEVETSANTQALHPLIHQEFVNTSVFMKTKH